MTNRSAKGGARSSLHYGGEGVLIHPPHQGVCGRHGREDQCVTLGDFDVPPSPSPVNTPLPPPRVVPAVQVRSSAGGDETGGHVADQQVLKPPALYGVNRSSPG